jgi:hypothetical protein
MAKKLKNIPVAASKWEIFKAGCYSIICFILWLVLIFCSIQIFLYYIHLSRINYFGKDAIQFAIYLIVGCFFVLFINRDQARNIFGIKNK